MYVLLFGSGRVGEAEEGMSKEGIRTFSQPGGRGRIPLNFYGMRGTRACANGYWQPKEIWKQRCRMQKGPRLTHCRAFRSYQCIIHRTGSGEIYKTLKT